MGWRTSVLIAALSACAAVFTTLQYQAFLVPPSSRLEQRNNGFTPSRATIGVDARDRANSRTLVADVTLSETAQAREDRAGTASVAAIDLAQALGLGRVLLGRGEPEEAALAFRVAAAAAAAAASDNPTDDQNEAAAAEAHHGLGLALHAAGRLNEALSACREAEHLDPGLAAASVCVGALLTETGDSEGAVAALRRAADLKQNAGEAHGRLGAALVAAGDVDEAIPVLIQALVVDNMDALSAYNLGVAWQSKGNTQKALSAYARAVELEPAMAPARVNLGAQLLKRGRLEDAEAMLLSAVELKIDPASRAAAYSNLGAVLEKRGRREEALDAYGLAAEWGAGTASLVHMARLHQGLGQLERALEASQRAIVMDVGSSDVFALLQAGVVLESLGRIEEAAEHFLRATDADTDNVEATVHLGNCQRQLGQHHKALASFLKASQLDPTNPEVYTLLHSTVSEAQTAAGGAQENDDAVATSPTLDATMADIETPKNSCVGMAVQSGDNPAIVKEGIRADGEEPIELNHAMYEMDPSEPEELSTEDEYVASEHEAIGGKLLEDEASATVVVYGSTAKVNKDLNGDSSSNGDKQEQTFEGGNAEVTEAQRLPEDVNSLEEIMLPGFNSNGLSEEVEAAEVNVENPEHGADVRKEIFEALDHSVAAILAAKDGVDEGAAVMHDQRQAINGGDGVLGTSFPFSQAPTEPDEAHLYEQDIEGKTTHDSEDINSIASDAGNLFHGQTGDYTNAEFRISDPRQEEQVPEEHNHEEKASLNTTEAVDMVPDIMVALPSSSAKEGENSLQGGQGDLVDRRQEVDGDLSAETGARQSEVAIMRPAESTRVVEEELDEIRSADDVVRANTSTGFADGSGNDGPALTDDADAPPLVHGVDGNLAAAVEVEDGELERLRGAAKTGLEGENGTPSVVEAEDSQIMPSPPLEGGSASVEGTIDNLAQAWQTLGTVEGVDDDEKAPRTAKTVDADHRSPTSTMDATSVLYGGKENTGGAELSENENETGMTPHEKLGHDAVHEVNEHVNREELDGSSGSPSGAEETIDEKVDEYKAAQSATTGPEDGFNSSTTATDEGEPTAAQKDEEPAAELAKEVDDLAELRVAAGKNAEEGTPFGANGVAAAAIELAEDAQGIGSERKGVNGEGDGGEKRVSGGDSDEMAAIKKREVVAVSEEDGRRAKSKVKLGVAHLQQGKAKKAAAMFEKAATLDSGWWEAFYYSALARHTMGEEEAAAAMLVSALQVPAPTNAAEISQISALGSGIWTSLKSSQGPQAEESIAALESAMMVAGLTLDRSPPLDRRTPVGGGRGQHRAPPEDVSSTGAEGVGRTATMGERRRGTDGSLHKHVSELEQGISHGSREQNRMGGSDGPRTVPRTVPGMGAGKPRDPVPRAETGQQGGRRGSGHESSPAVSEARHGFSESSSSNDDTDSRHSSWQMEPAGQSPPSFGGLGGTGREGELGGTGLRYSGGGASSSNSRGGRGGDSGVRDASAGGASSPQTKPDSRDDRTGWRGGGGRRNTGPWSSASQERDSAAGAAATAAAAAERGVENRKQQPVVIGSQSSAEDIIASMGFNRDISLGGPVGVGRGKGVPPDKKAGSSVRGGGGGGGAAAGGRGDDGTEEGKVGQKGIRGALGRLFGGRRKGRRDRH